MNFITAVTICAIIFSVGALIFLTYSQHGAYVKVASCGEIDFNGAQLPPYSNGAPQIAGCFLGDYQKGYAAKLTIHIMGVDTSETDNLTYLGKGTMISILTIDTFASGGGRQNVSSGYCDGLSSGYDSSQNITYLSMQCSQAGNQYYLIVPVVTGKISLP